MSSYCNYLAQHCAQSCCDRLGQCPDVSHYSCYYYYDSAPSVYIGGLIGGIVGGCLFAIALIVLLIWCCVRHRHQRRLDIEAVSTHNIPNQSVYVYQDYSTAQPIPPTYHPGHPYPVAPTQYKM